MTRADLRALVARIDLSTHTPPIRLQVREEHGKIGVLAVLDGVSSSSTGAAGVLVKEPFWIDLHPGWTPHWVIHHIWSDVLVPLVLHELGEHFKVDGKTWADPHEESQP